MRRGTELAAAVVACSAAAVAAACGPRADEAGLRTILAGDRAAHFATDAATLTRHMADSVVVVDGGSVFVQTRAEIEAMFADYFAGAAYSVWDDVEDPVIRISSDGTMAWVARRVLVDRSEPRFGGGTTREQFESSWVATYRAVGATWQMTSVTSTFAREPSAGSVLAGARRAVGGDDAVAAVRFSRFEAEATGPGGGYRVTFHSSAEGGARLEFSTGFSAGISRVAGWARFDPNAATTLWSDTLETFVRGHDLIMNVLRPEVRYGPLRFAGAVDFGEIAAIRLDGLDALGAPIELYYAAADTMPLGFRVVDHVRGGGSVTTTLVDWRSTDGVRLPTRARFVQGDEVFDYAMSAVDVSETGDPEVFLPGG